MKSKFSAFIDKYYWIIFSVLCLLLGFFCIFKLGTATINSWDEARHGVNAFEMIKNGNYIANYYNGSLDYWNLKPPISYYFVMLGYKIFGYNAWGLRFFSALSYIILAICVALFLYKKQYKLASLISIVMFSGCYVFFQHHFVRAGDADALFILFVGVAIISLALSSENANWLCLTGLMFSLAFLTKSWHAFIIAPMVFFYFIFTKGYKNTKWWQYILAFLSATLPIAIWVIVRYSFDGATFFREMLYYDLLKRSSNAIEGHGGSRFFYTKLLYKNFILFVCLILMFYSIVKKLITKQKLSNIDKISLIGFLSVFVIFAIAKSKLDWYIFPVCTPLILTGSITAVELIKDLSNKKVLKIMYVCLLSLVLVFGLVKTTLVVIDKTRQDDELYGFVLSFDVKDCNMFYSIDGATVPEQYILLIIELETNSIPQNGGIQSFKDTPNSYLITTKEDYEKETFSGNIQIVKTSDKYVLLYNS